MANGFVEELRWRGLLQDVTPGVERHLAEGPRSGYVGFDPTADSLHVGSLVPIMLLLHFQNAGHRPIALVGGATGMVGDPSGKSEERNLLDEETLERNIAGVRAQLERFLDFGNGPNAARLVNNYDWFKDMGFLQFIRDVGKHITVNYMMAKDSVKNRLETGMSFTEFSYQLVQGYDFHWLHRNMGCALQMGGSDQWGNITTGTELIRRMGGGEAYAITAPLLKKADGNKFGKSESGNVWLDPARTSPYRFHQFWLNASDEDAPRFIRIFTTKGREDLDALIAEHARDPARRLLQKELAADITKRVHGEAALQGAIEASSILFGQSTSDMLARLSEQQWLDIFEGVPQADIPRNMLDAGVGIIDLLTEHGGFMSSKGEARRALKENSVAVNKERVQDDRVVGAKDLLGGRFILLQRGRKNYFLVKAV